MNLYKGEIKKIEFHFLDESLQAKSMADYTFTLIGKQDMQQVQHAFDINTIDTTNADKGLVIVTVDTNDIECNYYVCQLIAKHEDSIIMSRVFSIEIMESLI